MKRHSLLLLVALLAMAISSSALKTVRGQGGDMASYAGNGTDVIKFPYTYGMHTYLKGSGETWKHYFEQMKAHGFQFVEVQPEGYGSGSFENIKAGCQSVVNAINEVGLTVWSIHLPYGNSYDISHVDETKRKSVVESLSTYIRALAEVYHPTYFVLHPSGEPEPTGAEREAHIEQAAISVGELSKVAQEYGATICVENLPRTCLGNTPEEILRIVTPTPEARICFDTNHNLLQTYNEFIRKAGHLIGTVHISDYDYKDEKHWLPGLGKIAWGDLIMCLEECGYQGVFMSESDKTTSGWAVPSTTHEAFDKAIQLYEEAKSCPATRTAAFLRNMKDFHWNGESPEKHIAIGTKPGEYPEETAYSFLQLYRDMETAIENATATEEEFKAMRENFTDEYNKLRLSVNQLEEGFYRIVSAHEGFKERNKRMAMYADGDKVLKWKSLETNSNFLFEFRKTGESTYSIRNVGNNAYISYQTAGSTAVPMTDTHEVDQCVQSLGNGTFKINNTKVGTGYHTESHREGAGTGGVIVIWDSNPLVGSGSAWEFEPVNTALDQTMIIPENGYITFYSDKAVCLPEGLEAGYVTGIDTDNQKMQINWAYKDDTAVIPAATPVIVRGGTGTYYYESTETDVTSPAENLLKGSTESGTTAGDNCLFYKLSESSEGMVFAWAAENGSAFENAAGNAYLTLTKGGEKGFDKLYFHHNNSIAPRFAVISDIHIGAANSEKKVPTALKHLFSHEKDYDALFICGDLTDGGTRPQYEALKALLDNKTVMPTNIPVYILMGNHDNYGDADARMYLGLGQPLNQYIDIKGYPFITISTRGTANSGNSNHDEAAYNFLTEKLADAAAKYPGKPIFVFVHIPPQGTVYGSDDWGNPRLNEIMSAYPQVVVFSGHTHYPVGDPRSIHQGKYTAINDGSVKYSEILEGEVTGTCWPTGYERVNEGVVVNVDEKSNINIERWSVAQNERILPDWNISAPHDGSKFHYAGRTGGEKPKFDANASVSIINTADSCTVSFGQATDDDVVRNYLIEIVQDTKVVQSYSIFSGYFLNSEMPAVIEKGFQGLPDGIDLVARVSAVDSYEQHSDPIVSAPFQVKSYEPTPGTSAPEADLLDVEFGENGKATDLSPAQQTIAASSKKPVTVFNEEYKRYGASFDADYYTYYKVDYQNDEDMKHALVNGFSLELFYKPGSTSGTYDPFCSTESGGAGIEQSDDDISFWCYIGGYKSVVCSDVLAKDQWCHIVAVYDKENAKMTLYVNGKPGASENASGTLTLSGSSAAHWFGIGGDACPYEYVQNPLSGQILVARIYGKPLDRDDVYWLYKDIQDLTTGIDEVKTTAGDTGLLYDLQGRHISKPSRGIYIADGKKVLVNE